MSKSADKKMINIPISLELHRALRTTSIACDMTQRALLEKIIDCGAAIVFEQLQPQRENFFMQEVDKAHEAPKTGREHNSEDHAMS